MDFKSFKPRKLVSLTENETIASFSSWKQNLEFQIASVDAFAPFLDTTWGTLATANRGLQADTGVGGKTAAQKLIALNHMIGLIAGFCPENIQLEIKRKCVSLKWIWDRVRRHYGFTKSEVNFLKLSTFKRAEGERYESFFQRIMSHLYDNLLSTDSGMLHDGAAVTVNEEMSPTTERLAVFFWLYQIDIRLPAYISRVYAHDLQSNSLKDIQPQICQNLDTLIMELDSQEEVRIQYSRGYNNNRGGGRNYRGRNAPFKKEFNRGGNSKSCAFCQSCNRPFNGHDINSCRFLSDHNRNSLSKAFQFEVIDDEEIDDLSHSVDQVTVDDRSEEIEQCNNAISRVHCVKSPHMYAFYKHFPCKVVLDTGAESNCISLSFVHSSNIPMTHSTQSARQLDGTVLGTCGEVNITLWHGNISFTLNALVVESMDNHILAGMPFCRQNNVEMSISKELFYVKGQTIPFGSQSQPRRGRNQIRSVNCVTLRNAGSTVLYPGDFVEIKNLTLSPYEGEVALEPRITSPLCGMWPEPCITRVVDSTIRVPNETDQPIQISRGQHIAQLRLVSTDAPLNCEKLNIGPTMLRPVKASKPFSDGILFDPDNQLSDVQASAFRSINKQFDSVFDPDFTGYNDFSGKIRAHLNLGPVLPPPQKARLPLYDNGNLELLQSASDNLERLGVLVRPEDVGIIPQHVSPSFLVSKSDGNKRFVTAFNDIAKFCRLPPSKVTKCDDILRQIGSFNYIIKTDLTKSFFQLKMSRESMAYLGTITPFKGVRLYARAAMGMPGSSEWLDELCSRVLGDLLMRRIVLVIADDMYVGGRSIEELLENWSLLLTALARNNLKLSASKTVLAPKSTVVLGWVWTSGNLSPSQHKISPLINTDPPKTCTSMRSFIGAYKDLARAIPKSASLLAPLEDAIKGLSGRDVVKWGDELLNFFKQAKLALSKPHSLMIPKREDKLVITVDASPLNNGLGATLFVMRNGKRHAASHFSFKLKIHHIKWLPCEAEALAINAAATYFAPFIRNSANVTQILTDNKPCVQAWEKLRKGMFSASACVSTFLSTLSSLNVSLCHIKGTENQVSDYNSRNPNTCPDGNCQVCKFVHDTANSVVLSVEINDILSGSSKMPFLNTSAWRSAQQADPVLRKAFAHLSSGTRPSKKGKNSGNLKTYIRLGSIDESKGIFIVKKEDPYVGSQNLIICPSELASGLLTALHLQFDHPSKYQLQRIFSRYFYAVNSTQCISDITDNCNMCSSVKKIPPELFEQTSSDPAKTPGEKLAADVICRDKQKILVVRDSLSSYTSATFIANETANEYKDALIICCLPMKISSSSIRVDCAPSLKCLSKDKDLIKAGIILELGHAKNPNKNPIAEKANQELELELLKTVPSGVVVSAAALTKSVSVLNTRIRKSGLSAKEMLFGRDQISGERLTFSDQQLASQQATARASNHLPSARSKAGPRGTPALNADVVIGSLVYIKHEGTKFRCREMYIVVALKGSSAVLQKMNRGKMMSTQYEVPLCKLLLCQQQVSTEKTPAHDNVSQESSESSDSASDSDCYSEEVSIPPADTIPMADHSPRPTRNRRQPDRYGSGSYNPTLPLPGENEVTPAWGPGWSRDAWASDMQ